MTVEERLRETLIGYPPVAELVEDRISAHQHDQDPAALPAITYERASTEDVLSLEGPTGSGRVSLQIDAWAGNGDSAMALALAVSAAFRAVGGGDGVLAVFRRTLAGPSLDPEVKVWRVRSVYDVHFSAALAA